MGGRRGDRPRRRRAARRARARVRSVGADRRVGARDLPILLEACELAFENNDEPFLLAVRLASHVGRVRTAQALAEEGSGARDVAARLKIKEFPGPQGAPARRPLLTRRARRRARPPRRPDAAIKGASRLSAELELLRALIDVTRPAEQPVAVGLASSRRAARPGPSSAPRCSGGSRLEQPPGRSSAEAHVCSAAALSLSPVSTAASSRRVIVLTVDR